MSFGFIITRHVNSEKTNQYWNQCIKLLRTYYHDCQIVIIDDNSNQNLVKSEFTYTNLHVIQSEYPGRGELLPYIYYLQNKWFDNAVIIHDSVFFHKTYDFASLNYDVMLLWFFYNNDSDIPNILRIADSLNNSKIIKQQIVDWDKQRWLSCFGVQSYINHDFLVKLNNKYCLTNLLNVVKNRNDRCALERIFGILFFIETNNTNNLLGSINHSHIKSKDCSYTFDEYINMFYSGKILSYVIKVWTGR